MTRLHLKRTPAEEEEQARRKAYKAAKKAAKRKRPHDSDSVHGASRRRKLQTKVPTDAAFSDDDADVPASSSYKPDYDAIRAELEDLRFREKMWSALEDDERLDGIDARFNDYAHIPDRWARDKHDSADPQYMDDDEYAEWVREGMWKKKHAREYEEQMKREKDKAAQRAREKEIKAETARMERLALEQEDKRRKEGREQREEEYRRRYEVRWKALLDPRTVDHGPLTFGDIPWPIFPAHITKQKAPDSDLLCAEQITPEAIATFILPEVDSIKTTKDDLWRRNRDKLKETLLRFHPDKFEGRFMHRIPASDVASVREAVGQVARALNVLMSA